MKNIEKHHNLIIYLLLVVFLITGVGFGLGENCQVFSSFRNMSGSRVTVPTVKANDEIHTFQVWERGSTTLRYINLENGRSEIAMKNSLAFLCVLAVLSVYFCLIQERFVYYGRLYVRERFYMIAFMQAIDGRKRVA